MIWLICGLFILLIMGLALLMSYELRLKTQKGFAALLPAGKKNWQSLRQHSQRFNQAASKQHTQQHWHLQQWWMLLAGLCVFMSILIFAFTRPIDPNQQQAQYLKAADPQIYHLLNGEILTPPPEVDDRLVDAAIREATQLAHTHSNTLNTSGANLSLNTQLNTQLNTELNSELNTEIDTGLDTDQLSLQAQSERYAQHNRDLVDRKWERMNPRYQQRLLMVFKIMKERYGYELVLLEGYRSPERQNLLARNANTTRAGAFQSYHQFGLAADVAFKRDNKVVISERDPWAMRAYQHYGLVAESVGLTWGGRWKSIQDYGHTEYRLPGLKKTQQMAQQLSNEGQWSAGNSR